MGKLTHAPVATNAEQQMPRKRRRGSSETPSANALRERVRAQNMKRAYLNLQKTLPQVPPDTKLPRLNILLLAIDYISHLRCMLRSENQTERSLNSLEDKNGMLRPFIEVRFKKRFKREPLTLTDKMLKKLFSQIEAVQARFRCINVTGRAGAPT